MSWAFWAGFLPRSSSGHPGHQSRREDGEQRDSTVRATSPGCYGRFLKEPAYAARRSEWAPPEGLILADPDLTLNLAHITPWS